MIVDNAAYLANLNKYIFFIYVYILQLYFHLYICTWTIYQNDHI